MRSRVLFFCTLLFATGSFALPFVAHAAIPFFGPIINQSWTVQGVQCPLGWGAIITVVNNIISLLLTIAIVFVAPIMIAYAGFLYVVNPVDPSGMTKAKGILLNTIIGIVVALAGWLIVDAVMAALYHPDATTNWTTTWSQLITSNSSIPCIDQAGVGTGLSQAATTPSVSAVTPGGTTAVSGKPTAQCSSSNTACSPAALQSAGFTGTQPSVMSCIAVTESSGNPAGPNSKTDACGTFQITQGNWNTASLHQSPCSTATSCNDAACNLQTAYLLSQQNVAAGKSPYQPWTGKNPDGTYWNPNAVACVQQYNG